MNESYDFTPNIALRLPKGTHKFQLSDLTDNLKIIDKQIGDRLKFVDGNGQVVQDLDKVVTGIVTSTVGDKTKETILDQLKKDVENGASELTLSLNSVIQNYLVKNGLDKATELSPEQLKEVQDEVNKKYEDYKVDIQDRLDKLTNDISNGTIKGIGGATHYLTKAQYESKPDSDFSIGDVVYILDSKDNYSEADWNKLSEQTKKIIQENPSTLEVRQITTLQNAKANSKIVDIPAKTIVNYLNARSVTADKADFIGLRAKALDVDSLAAISGTIGNVTLNNGSIVLDSDDKKLTTSDISFWNQGNKIYIGNRGFSLGDQMVFDREDGSLTFSNDVILKFAQSDKLKDIINNTQNKNSQELYNTLKAGGYIKTEATVYTYYDKDGKLQENKASYPEGYTKADALEKGKNYYIEGKAYTITQPTEITSGYIKTDELYVSKIKAPSQGMLYSNGTSIGSSTTLTDSYINSIKVSDAFNFQDSKGNTKIAIGPGGFTTTGIALNLASSSQETATELGQVYLGAKITGTKDEDSTDFSSYIIKDGEIIEGTADRPQRDYYSNILLYPERDKIYQNDYLVVTGYKTVDGTKKTSNRLYVSQVRIKDVIGTITKTVQKGTATAVFG